MAKKAVVYIFYDKNTDKFLVENRTKDQFLAGEKLFPGGKVEQNELDDLTITLIREAKEEAGITLEPSDLSPPTVLHRSGQKDPRGIYRRKGIRPPCRRLFTDRIENFSPHRRGTGTDRGV